MSQSRHASPGERRPAPPPREADDRQVTLVITTGWLLALVIVFLARNKLPADVRWWVWTCLTGLLMGLFALWYVPFLKRRRARIAADRARLAGTQLSSEYVSRDNGSNIVSSTETPGKSTRS